MNDYKLNTKYKDRLFRLIFHEKKELLELYNAVCKCQYKNAQKVENKNVHFPTILPRIVFPKRLAFP